ncbi:MAG: hypothetical protein KG075_19730 [Alphaproteobacteria bacterium]|nr:hypothetical protein [Alphaproteobacteria bacterium]
MPSSEPRPLPTTIGFPTLGDWEAEGAPLFAQCKTCGREVCLMPRSYTMRFGRQAAFWRTMKRLRCTICRAPASIRRVPSGKVTPNFLQVFDRRTAADAEVFDAMLSRADEAKASDGDYRETRTSRAGRGRR